MSQKKGGYKSIHKHPKHNTAGFLQRPQNRTIHRGGNLIEAMKDHVEKHRLIINVPKSKFKRITENKRLVIGIPTKKEILERLTRMVQHEDSGIALDTIKEIFERIYGAPMETYAMERPVTDEPKLWKISVRSQMSKLGLDCHPNCEHNNQ